MVNKSDAQMRYWGGGVSSSALISSLSSYHISNILAVIYVYHSK
jgi:hypothetical protein